MIRARAIVSGTVQGVFYRDTVRSIARQFARVKGYVKNLPDGTVEVVAEGEEDAVRLFIEKIKIKQLPIEVRDVKVGYGEAAVYLRGDSLALYILIKAGLLSDNVLQFSQMQEPLPIDISADDPLQQVIDLLGFDRFAEILASANEDGVIPPSYD